MRQITTKSGFCCEVNENAADDLEFLDIICEIDDGNVRAYRKMLNKLLSGGDQERLFSHIRTEDGRIPLSALDRELTEIVGGIGKK